MPSPLHESALAPIASTDLRPDTSITGSWLNQWIAFLSELRAVVARVPQIPASIWLLGMCIILVTAALHAIRFRRLIAKALPADAELTHMVESAARTIGLRAMPQTFVIDRRISPMVWCGRRLRLVLPLGLWSELDAAGREAVILHELAHIRRRDQWVCWAALLVSIVYWWHPVAWWCHRRLREEADLCCDAWVTALRPKARRAYAQALLTTRSFISDAFHPNPALALGITTPRAKRFARRLTTVMTTHNNPNISRLGCALTAAVALSSWLAAPLWACPPEETAAKAKTTIRVAPAKIASTARSAPAPTPSADTTFEQHMLERQLAEVAASAHTLSQRAGGENPDVLQRLNALEERLNRLAEQIELFMMKPGAAMPRSGTLESATPSSSAAIAPHAPAPPRKPNVTSSPAIAPTPAAPPTPPSAPAAPAPPVVRGAQGGASAGVVFPSQPRSPVIAPGAQAERVERFYPLPAGKREALTTLMSRQDVPILIRPANNGIYVQGTAQEHEAFQAFVQLIHPEAASAQASGFDPKTAAALEAQYRAAAQAQGSAQRAAAQRLLTTERARAQQLMQKERQNAETLRRQARETAMGMRELERAARMAERQAETVEQQMEKAEGAELDALRARLEALLKEVSALENEIFKLETTAQELDAKAESLLENAEVQAQMILDAAEQTAEQLRNQAQASASLR